ncbi:nucleoside recognition domain protein [Ruminiclostridium papyrosolvens DSM 2782]|uniref:Nucleoside recognition domain protein n=1 Tax=Ruminiclostridium papyrosolvens DSM 2782 TaxID=588581 RepID=F1TCX4_9FIRM|nr:nucleoside recognition domain-containing protein [Ruminiclostridium papyrosolvens]EGD47841.1 nucleoside recognition domain protein [Ruminiclostridium papyrosolvens DSM 2782]WES34555.1 nucleoside recognition domain-containing protein [Ruminiclostridium papyrosolvens DSM 2782]
MINYIWIGLLILGFAFGIVNGRLDDVTKAAMDSAQTAVTVCIGLLGVMCLWTGLMKVAEKSGLIRIIGRAVRPVLIFLFPEIPKDHPALGAIVMNLVANFLGLGNAATPLGLKAMKELQSLNKDKKTATNAMCMFLVLNTAAIQLVPANIIALRTSAGSKKPAEIIICIWIASVCATIMGIIAAKMLSAVWKKDN